MATKYSITVKHEGAEPSDFCIYQTNDNQEANLHSLAWFSKQVHPSTEVKFDWNTDYSLVWSETGVLEAGVLFRSCAASKPINLAIPAKTASALSVDGDRLCYKQTAETVPAGEVGLLTDETVPEQSYSVGVQMSGAPAFAAQAEPNQKICFRPHPRYYVAFGKFEAGEVIDMNKLAGAVPLEVSEQTPNCTVTLGPDGTIKQHP